MVGVTTIKIVADDGSAEGLGFAIPTTRVKQVVDRLIAGAPVTRPSLGIIVRRGQGENGGLVVEEVDPDSDCHRQGIQPQDIIVAANGQQVQTFADLERIKRTLDVGDSLLLEVLRGGEHLVPAQARLPVREIRLFCVEILHGRFPQHASRYFSARSGAEKSSLCSPQPLTYKGCGGCDLIRGGLPPPRTPLSDPETSVPEKSLRTAECVSRSGRRTFVPLSAVPGASSFPLAFFLRPEYTRSRKHPSF